MASSVPRRARNTNPPNMGLTVTSAAEVVAHPFRSGHLLSVSGHRPVRVIRGGLGRLFLRAKMRSPARQPRRSATIQEHTVRLTLLAAMLILAIVPSKSIGGSQAPAPETGA